MDEKFINVKHGNISSSELRSFPKESETDAKSRLEGRGWTFPTNYYFDEPKRVFRGGSLNA